MIAALRLIVNEDYDVYLYSVGTYELIDWDNNLPCQLGEEYSVYHFKTENNHNSMEIVNGLDGKPVLRLIETKRYIIKIDSRDDKDVPLPIMQNENNKSLNIDKDKNYIVFQFINYLGRSKISFPNYVHKKIMDFEVVPNKMDYEDDYIELTEALADRCSELLLEYSGATSNLFSISGSDSRTLLEQFIFLRKFCFTANLSSLFESIKRNPDRQLIDNLEYKPIGCGAPSKRIFTHPFTYAKNWRNINVDELHQYHLPATVAVTRKNDSIDTVANRFIKYALEKFLCICEDLVNSLDSCGAARQTECLREAAYIKQMLNNILNDYFFDDIGRLEKMPQNNQVLQKREGYSQIFSAYSMVDLALQLDWKGTEDIFEGESKNVALLYEYWLFFELANVIKSIDTCESVNIGNAAFFTTDNGRLTISLKEGKQSCQAYLLTNLNMRINLYYNRTFSHAAFRTTQYEGSYSRPFRPDYTLAVFPGNYKGESEAVKDGAVSYIHFDAKYRITDLSSLVGKNNNSNDYYEKIFQDEKSDEVTNTYKRGDLLKMHTYNDAIRRTIGSYVLYPGNSNPLNIEDNIFSLYDEILPGVGAFAMRPSIRAKGENELRQFVIELIKEKGLNYSRLNRLNYYSEMVMQEPAITDGMKSDVTPKTSASTCILGYIKANSPADYYYFLKEYNYLEIGKEFLFYYYAIKGNSVYSHHRDIAKIRCFRFYKNNINETGSYVIEPIMCEVLSNELVSRQILVERLNHQGYLTNVDEHFADFYYVMRVRVINNALPLESRLISEVNNINGNDSFSPHSPKII